MGRLREVARPEKPRERLNLVLVSLSPSDRAFPLSHTQNIVSAPAVLCFSLSLGSLTRCLLVPFVVFLFFVFLAYVQVSVAVFHCGLTLLCLPC